MAGDKFTPAQRLAIGARLKAKHQTPGYTARLVEANKAARKRRADTAPIPVWVPPWLVDRYRLLLATRGQARAAETIRKEKAIALRALTWLAEQESSHG